MAKWYERLNAQASGQPIQSGTGRSDFVDYNKVKSILNDQNISSMPWYVRLNYTAEKSSPQQEIPPVEIIQPKQELIKVEKGWKEKIFDSLDRIKESFVIGGQQAIGGIQNQIGILLSKDAQRGRDILEGRSKPTHPLEIIAMMKIRRLEEDVAKGKQGAQAKLDAEKQRFMQTFEKGTQKADEFKTKGNESFQKAKERNQKLDERGRATGFQWLTEEVAKATPAFLSTFGIGAAVGVVTKNPQLAVALGFSTGYVQVTGSFYQEAKEFGLNDKKAEDVAHIAGLASGVLNTLPIGKVLERSPQGAEIKKAVLRAVMKDVIQQGLVEGGTESLDQLIQNAIKKTYDQNQSLFEGVPESAIVGSTLGAIGGAAADVGIMAETTSTEKGIKKVNDEIKKAFDTPKEERSQLQQDIVETFYKKELTPQQAVQVVVSKGMENTPIGKQILKKAAQAAQERKNISLLGQEDSDDISIGITEKTVYDIDEKSLKTGALKRKLDEMVKSASEYDSEFKSRVENVAKKLNVEFKHGPVKKAERMYEKVVGDYEGDIKNLRDNNRSAIFVDDPSRLNEIEETVRAEFGNVERVKNKFYQEGYKSAIINVTAPNGQITEIQVTTPEMWKAKTELGGDELYNKVRVKEYGWEEALRKMKKLYADAEVERLKRLKSSSETSSPTSTARKGGKSSPVEVTPNTSRDAGSRSTLTKTPSTSKNRGKRLGSNLEKDISTSPSKINATETKTRLEARMEKAKKSSLNDTSLAQKKIDINEETRKINKKYKSVGEEKHYKALEEIFISLDMAQAGERFFTEDGVIGMQSSFPKWIPEGLRRKDLLDKVVGNMIDYETNDLRYPDGNRPAQRALADAIFNVLDKQLGVDTTIERSSIMKAYEEGQTAADTNTKKSTESVRESTTGRSESPKEEVKQETKKQAQGESIPQVPVGDGKKRESRLYERMKQALESQYQAENREYNRVNLESDARKAIDFLEQDPASAIRVAKGYEEPPVGQTANGIAIAAILKAQDEGKHKLAADLLTAVSLRSTRLGQEIVALRGNFNDDSPQNYIKMVLALRINQLGKSIMNYVPGQPSTKERATIKINKDKEKIKEFLTAEQKKIRLAQKIIDDLRCK